MCLPFFFGKKLFNILSIDLICTILLFFTGQTAVVSLSGLLIGAIVSLFYLSRVNKKVFFSVIILIAILVGVSTFTVNFKDELFQDNNRVTVWKTYYELSKDTFLFGKGLGSVNIISITKKIGNYRWTTLHNEFFHFCFELGFVGLILILYCVYDFFKIKVKRSKDSLILDSVFLGFLINCLILFPTHLWVITPLLMFVYAGKYILKEEKISWVEWFSV